MVTWRIAGSVPEYTVVLFPVLLSMILMLLVFVDLSPSEEGHHKDKKFLFVS